ncbi:protein chibby-like protein 1, partial [Huso huso]
MPLFGNVFSPKKTPTEISLYCVFCSLSLSQLDRSTREVEIGLEYGSPMMNIGGQSLRFEDGQWLAVGGSVSQKEVQRLEEANVQLEEKQPAETQDGHPPGHALGNNGRVPPYGEGARGDQEPQPQEKV